MTSVLETTKIPSPLEKSERTGYIGLWQADSYTIIHHLKSGVPAVYLKSLIVDLGIDQSVALDALNVKVSTLNKKAASGGILSQDVAERAVGLAKLLGQVQAMVEESGDPEGFNAAEWLSQWLLHPLPAFGGTKPVELLDTMEGQALVSRTLAQLQSGAYA